MINLSYRFVQNSSSLELGGMPDVSNGDLSTSSLMLLIPTNDKFDQSEPTKSSQTINE